MLELVGCFLILVLNHSDSLSQMNRVNILVHEAQVIDQLGDETYRRLHGEKIDDLL